MSLVDELLRKLEGMPQEEKQKLYDIKEKAAPKWFPTDGPQAEAFYSPADLLLYGGQGGGGKALDLNTLLPTPSGWTSMGEVKIGDELFAEDGKVCRVTACSPVMIGRRCFSVVFSDGTEIVADADHRWLTMTQDERDSALCKTEEWRARRRASRKSRAKENSQKPWASATLKRVNSARVHQYLEPPRGQVRTTSEIAATLTYGGARGGINHSVAVASAIDLPERELPIDPYLLGLWIGDGSSYKAEITTADEEILLAVNAAGFSTVARSGYTHGIYGLLTTLKAQKLIANKHIPKEYLRSSFGQRLALLQGWMDTDGYVDARGQCELTTVKEKLAADALELINSLGIKCSIMTGRATLNGKDCGPKYRLKFLTEHQAFRLERKASKQKRSGFRPTVLRRYIERIEPVASVPVKCIAVDSPSRLYLASRAFVPTHNTDLGLGLAFTAHKRTLISRREYTQLSGIMDRAVEIHGSRDGFNGSPPPKLRTPDGRLLQFAGCQRLGDEQAWQGIAFDLKIFDEACQFLEQQIRFHLGWIRSADPAQRCRAIMSSNPPITADGDFIIKMFRPWLDLTHPKPAKHGELRWFVTAPDGTELEVDGQEPIEMGGKVLKPKSRTFIPASLRDNPFLVRTDYQSTLDALPEPLRTAVRDGNFMAARKDAQGQVIPLEWIIAAQNRWKPDGYKDLAMTAMGFDPAGGGRDSAELCWRHGGWYAPLVSAQGAETAEATQAMAAIFMNRRDGAPVVIDVGGGYGGAAITRMKDNGITFVRFSGSDGSTGRTKDGSLRFANKRAEAWWRFREELDPDQYGGSAIALPPDPELRADLSTPCLNLRAMETRGEILIESKDEIRRRLGRSPGKGDAIVMCMSAGEAAVRKALGRTPGTLPTHSKSSSSSGPLSRYRRK